MRIIISILTFVCFTIILTTRAKSDSWILVTTTEDYSVYYDDKTIQYGKSNVTVYIKLVYFATSDYYKDTRYSFYKWILYCDEYKYYFVTATHFNQNYSTDVESVYQYKDLNPNGISKIVFNKLCK